MQPISDARVLRRELFVQLDAEPVSARDGARWLQGAHRPQRPTCRSRDLKIRYTQAREEAKGEEHQAGPTKGSDSVPTPTATSSCCVDARSGRPDQQLQPLPGGDRMGGDEPQRQLSLDLLHSRRLGLVLGTAFHRGSPRLLRRPGGRLLDGERGFLHYCGFFPHSSFHSRSKKRLGDS